MNARKLHKSGSLFYVLSDHYNKAAAREVLHDLTGNKLKLVFPQLARFASLGLTIPFSTPDCEHAFSTMNQAKTKVRNRLKTTSFDFLLRISIEGPELKDFGFQLALSEIVGSVLLSLLACTVETPFYGHPLVKQKPVLNSRWSVKRGSLRHAHASHHFCSPQIQSRRHSPMNLQLHTLDILHLCCSKFAQKVVPSLHKPTTRYMCSTLLWSHTQSLVTFSR